MTPTIQPAPETSTSPGLRPATGAPASPEAAPVTRAGRGPLLRWGALIGAGVLLTLVALASLQYGSISLSAADAWNALFHYNPDSYEQTVVRHLRLPRTLIGLGVGAALAVAGAAIQAVTRNPLAGPEILGVNSGAAFGVVAAVYFGQLVEPFQFVWFAFLGGLAAAALVSGVASAGPAGSSPVKLALAGVIVSSLLQSWLTGLLLLDQQTLDVVRFWMAGSLAGRSLEIYRAVLPFLAVGVAGLVALGPHLNVASLGEETARALGLKPHQIRWLVGGFSVLAVGAAVAVAGPIGFVGLAVPHIVRAVVGPDYRWVLPLSVLVGPLLLLSADLLGRVVARPAEIQVGIVTAITGAPVLIGLARRRKVVEL